MNNISKIAISLFMIGLVGCSDGSSSVPREVVSNSAWDGSVWQAEQYLKQRLKDPDSYESIAWGKVNRTEEGYFVTWAEYRARNGFGGMSIEKQAFLLDTSGNVLLMEPYPE